MDLLVQLSYIKAKSIAYIYNNYKIKKIYKIQKRKEIINATVEKLKDKITRWREFTRTTLDTTKSVPGTFEKKDQLNDSLLISS